MARWEQATAIIGAGYGDEGKGLVVDALAAAAGGDATVVRFNGGAQAGHTVTTPDGRRHVFHHLGAGALASAPTFLSRFFVINPILFPAEADALAKLGANTEVAVDPAAPVTLPADMMINQIVERARGGARHGSCGLGVGETVERSQNADLAVSAADLADRPRLAAALKRARAEWVFPRLAALGMAALDEEDRARLADPAIDARWLDDAERFAARTRLAEAPAPGRLIFEGAQGLRLDQTRGDFPYVTRSNTGCRNVVALARDWGVEALERIYVSRIYLTRHGAGPLPREAPGELFPGLADATNVPNPWQGALRFAPLDLDRLAADIAADGADADGFESRPSLAVTCLDQPPGRVEVYRDRTAMWETPEGVVALAAASVAPRRVMTSRGPTRTTFAQSS